MFTWLTVAAVGVVAFLCWNLYRRFGADRIAALSEKRRATSRIVSRGEFVEGNHRHEVALALTQSDFFYENADLQGSLDLRWVREIEYDTQLTAGLAVEGGRVLRLRCDSQMFEFVLPDDMVARWQTMLPPRRATDPGVPIELTTPLVSAT